MIKYLVDLVSPSGRGRSIVIEAESVKSAQSKAESKNPNDSIGRIAPYKSMENYLHLVSKLRK